MTTLVTGANGFIGSSVARQLVAAGYGVRALVRPGAPRDNLAGLPLAIVEGDLTDPDSLAAALSGCRFLIHIAADYRLWVPDPDRMYRTNLDGTRNLMQAAQEAGVKQIVYTSSVATLGIHSDGVAGDETTPAGPGDLIGPYKHSKFLAEREVTQQIHDDGLPAVIVHPSTPVGPRDSRPTPTGRMILDAARGKMPAFVDTGLNLVHVDDVAWGHMAALEHGRIGEHYILGGENYTLKQMLTEVAELTGRKPPRVRLPHGLVLPIAYLAEAWARVSGREPLATVTGVRLSRKPMFFSSAKAREELGYRPRPARHALADAIRWFLDQGLLPATIPRPKAGDGEAPTVPTETTQEPETPSQGETRP
ncbi:hopanoid-associated sugar epimerase [Thiohalorhabdus sp.]|uniref:hopanoid-associated sugar epimerase n=1 Tax=Thiohalorhabdus sp. TaxID=3094134 RepID=UPI002FC32E7B